MDNTTTTSTITFEKIQEIFPLKDRSKFEFYIQNIYKDLCIYDTHDKTKSLGITKEECEEYIKYAFTLWNG